MALTPLHLSSLFEVAFSASSIFPWWFQSFACTIFPYSALQLRCIPTFDGTYLTWWWSRWHTLLRISYISSSTTMTTSFLSKRHPEKERTTKEQTSFCLVSADLPCFWFWQSLFLPLTELLEIGNGAADNSARVFKQKKQKINGGRCFKGEWCVFQRKGLILITMDQDR